MCDTNAKEYICTKEQCEKNIGPLVCSGCGKPLTAIETVDNANRPTFWAGCREDGCNRFQCGVPMAVWDAVHKSTLKRTYLSKNEVLKHNRNCCDIFCEVLHYYKGELPGRKE